VKEPDLLRETPDDTDLPDVVIAAPMLVSEAALSSTVAREPAEARLPRCVRTEFKSDPDTLLASLADFTRLWAASLTLDADGVDLDPTSFFTLSAALPNEIALDVFLTCV
jgi:hypothetical protein